MPCCTPELSHGALAFAHLTGVLVEHSRKPRHSHAMNSQHNGARSVEEAGDDGLTDVERLLMQEYGIEEEPEASTAKSASAAPDARSSPAKSERHLSMSHQDVTSLDSDTFSVQAWMDARKHLSLEMLLQQRKVLRSDVLKLRGSTQSLVHDNYSRFIAAADIIRTMHGELDSMVCEAEQLGSSTKAATDASETMNARLQACIALAIGLAKLQDRCNVALCCAKGAARTLPRLSVYTYGYLADATGCVPGVAACTSCCRSITRARTYLGGCLPSPAHKPSCRREYQIITTPHNSTIKACHEPTLQADRTALAELTSLRALLQQLVAARRLPAELRAHAAVQDYGSAALLYSKARPLLDAHGHHGLLRPVVAEAGEIMQARLCECCLALLTQLHRGLQRCSLSSFAEHCVWWVWGPGLSSRGMRACCTIRSVMRRSVPCGPSARHVAV